MALVLKNLPANAGDIRDTGLIPGSGRSPGGRHGNPVQYSCLENPLDRGTCWATIHRVTKNQSRLKQFSTQAHTHTHTHTYFFRFFPIIGYCKILNTVPCAIL